MNPANKKEATPVSQDCLKVLKITILFLENTL